MLSRILAIYIETPLPQIMLHSPTSNLVQSLRIGQYYLPKRAAVCAALTSSCDLICESDLYRLTKLLLYLKTVSSCTDMTGHHCLTRHCDMCACVYVSDVVDFSRAHLLWPGRQ